MEKLIKILKEINNSVNYDEEKNLIGDGIFSSFEIMQCLTNIEAEFNITIPPQEILPNNFNSIESIWEMIKRCEA